MINPAVRERAALQTDGRITDKTLRDVAAMHGLPMYVDDPPSERQSAIEHAAKMERRLAEAEAAGMPRTIEICRRDYEDARLALVWDEKS
jgi:hypothetical protein